MKSARIQTEVNPKQSQEELDEIFSMSIDLICIADIRTATFIKVNPAFKETLGYTEEELLGESFLNFIHPDDIEPTRAVVEKKLQQGEKVINFENRYQCKDGSYIWLSWVSHPRPEKELTYAIARDITEHKQNEGRLIEQERVQHLLIKLSTDFINVPLNRIQGAVTDMLEILGKFTGMDRVYIFTHDLGRGISAITNEWCAKGIPSAMDRRKEVPFDLLADIVEVHKKGRPFFLPCVMDLPEAHVLRSYLQDRGVQSMLAIPLMQEGFCIGFVGMDAVGKPQPFNDMNITPLTLAAGIITNITARQKLEEILRESEGKYRLLVENSNELILVAQDGVIRFVNGKSSDFLGYTPEEVTDKPFSDYIHPEDRKMVLDRHLRRLKGEILPGVYPFRVVHRTGDERWVELNAVMIQWEGKPATINLLSDITRRKRADDALRASEKKYQSLFHNSQVALFRTHVDGRLIEINQRYAELAGYSTVEDCMAEFVPGRAWADPEARNEFVRILQEKGGATDYEARIIRRDGTQAWILFSATIFPEQGFIEGSIIDITGRKQAEAEQEKLQDQLTQAQKMESVGRLAGGVAHDFNNMLGVILGHTELALEQVQPPHPLHTDLTEIQKAAQRSADLTKQLLTFARKQIISPQILDLNRTVKNMISMLQRLIGEDIDLIWKPAKNLWPVKMDPSQIDQILANLCVNARDAITGVGKLTIETGMKTFDEDYCREHTDFVPGDFALLAVSDDGCGMDKQTMDKLFEPFFTTKGVGKGTGLGLATIYGIVKQNNGFINVYSEPGQGTTFRIYIPRSAPEEDAPKMQASAVSMPGGTETVLLVEDEAAILQMTRMMLERKGYRVLPAGSPTEAMSLAKAHEGVIHLLITDVFMPEMNGRDLAGRLTALYPNLKLLFMSGYTANVIAHQGILDEGVSFIQKPFSMADFVLQVRRVLDE